MHTAAAPFNEMRSPHDRSSTDDAAPDPRWARPALTVLLVATASFWSTGLSNNGWANQFYSAAVQAGTKSWKAFLFGSSDAANSITVDKPPASLWPMEIAARIFGVNTWSIQLPQVLLGVASVALLYYIVKKPFGPAGGLIAGAALAVTPVATLMFRYNNPEALLVFLMVAAVWALLRAVEDGRTRWLLLCGALIGFGFLTKQLQVMLVVPGLALAYLVAGPVGFGKRVAQLLGALATMIVAAGWWVLLVAITPAERRPYVGGSTDNSFLNLTFGYNGLLRLTGGENARPPGAPSFGSPPDSVGGGSGMPSDQAGAARMLTGESGGQISWLIPAALIFLVVGLVLCGRAQRTDSRRAQYVVWGGWLIGTGVVFSYMSGIFHDYYTVALGPAVAALIGIGAVHLWQRRHSLWVGLTLSTTVALTAIWAWILLGRSPDFLPPLRWMILAAGVIAALALIVSVVLPAVTTRRCDIAVWAAALAATAALAGPLSYSIQTLTTAHTGGVIVAGPAVNGAGGVPGGPPTGSLPSASSDSAASTGTAPAGPRMGQTVITHRVIQLLSQNADAYSWVAATNGSTDAAAYQLATDYPVMPIGGFSSGDPFPTLEQFQSYATDHRIHYYIVSLMREMPGDNSSTGGTQPSGGQQKSRNDQDNQQPVEADRISEWVNQHYTSTTVDGVTLYDLTTPRR